MAKAKKFMEDLLEALLDSWVVEAIKGAVSSLMAPLLEKIQQLSTRVDSHESTITELVTVRSEQDYRIEQLIADNVILQKSIDALEVNSHMNNLVIKGLADAESGDDVGDTRTPRHIILRQQALDFVSGSLNVPISLEDITFAFRMKRDEHDQHRPLLVSFSNRHVRDEVYAARTRLKGRNIFVNENLTRRNSGIFSEARKLVKMKKFAKSWTFGGSVYVLPNQSGSKPIRITEMSDLHKDMP